MLVHFKVICSFKNYPRKVSKLPILSTKFQPNYNFSASHFAAQQLNTLAHRTVSRGELFESGQVSGRVRT